MRLSGISVCARLAVANQKRRIMVETDTPAKERKDSRVLGKGEREQLQKTEMITGS